jgi:ABC-type branched-subunit amino acid transport system substrate-binding protein
VGVFLLVAAACGQKPGVADNAVGGLSGGTELQLPEGTELDAEGNLIDSETGEIIATADELAENNPGLASGTTGDGDSSGDTGDTGTGDGGDGGSGDAPPSEGGAAPGDATGVTADTIKIGIHAPITGAAPVPSASFQKGKDLYWNWLKSQKQSINGRNVEVVFRNDNYNPSQAVQACREMVEQEKVFLLVGIAGTDQIQACARYAASAGVPYLSAGVTQIGLTGLRNYFALWLSYPEQGPLLADLLVSKLGAGDEKNGMLRFNTPTFQDGHDAFIKAMGDAGADVAYDRAISKTAGASEAQTIATELNQQGIQNVHVLVSPTFFIQLAQAAANQQYRPQWVGYGLTKGLDTVANVACKNQQSIQNARFLSPFPAYVDSDKYDPNFRKAGGTDDIMLGLWGTSKVVGEMLKKGGQELTRETFILNNEKGGTIKTGVSPDVSFSAGDHFGGTSMHLLRADCPNNRYVTEKAFATGF